MKALWTKSFQTLILAVSAATTGCTTYLNQTGTADVAAPYAMLPLSFEAPDLPKVLGFPAKEQMTNDQKLGEAIDDAIVKFNKQYASDPIAGRTARNQAQDRLIAASAQRCNDFKTNLQRTYSRNNYAFGVGTTLASTAGALVPGLRASKNLSGIAAVLSGSRAEFNQDYFSNLTTNLIVDGIEARRSEYVKDINAKRSSALDDYTLEGAIADALYYHGLCSMLSGLQYASRHIRMTVDPGMNAAMRILDRFNTLKSIAEGKGYSEALALGRANFPAEEGAPVASNDGGGVSFNDSPLYLRLKLAAQRIESAKVKFDVEEKLAAVKAVKAKASEIEAQAMSTKATFSDKLLSTAASAKSCLLVVKKIDVNLREKGVELMAETSFEERKKKVNELTTLRQEAQMVATLIEQHALIFVSAFEKITEELASKTLSGVEYSAAEMDAIIKSMKDLTPPPKLCIEP
jgi:hypothetical protein